MKTSKWTVSNLPDGTREDRNKIFRWLGNVNAALTAAGAYIFWVACCAASSWAIFDLILGWSLITMPTWGLSLIVLIVMLAKKETVNTKNALMNQSPLLLVLATFTFG